MEASTVARWTAVLAATMTAALAGTASAQGAFAITFAQCGTSENGFQFTMNGSGADPTQILEVDVTTSEAGAVPQPFFVAPVGTPTTDLTIAASIGADGTFSFFYGAGSAQSLPATIAVYPYDLTTGRAATPVYTTTVTATTQCTDGTTLGVGTASGGGGGRLPTTSDQCRRGGYKTYLVFKNEGDCVSFVATGGRNTPALLP